jgi:hypothetical protein
VHIKCISICSTYDKPSKNKSCIRCIALHGMAYYIFLKSLRSQEEFRKSPHVKIPPKSPSTNFQSLVKFKNPICNSEILFPYSRPSRPCGPLGLWPTRPRCPPQAETAPAGPPSLRVGRVFTGIRFPFWFTSSELATSLSSLCQVGLSCQFHLPPMSADRCCFLPSPPATPRRPTSDLEMPGEVFTPHLDSPP